MRLALIGVDYKTAEIELREQISLTESKIRHMLSQLKEIDGIEGAAFLSTCNRTELYLSCNQGRSRGELEDIFCKAIGYNGEAFRERLYFKQDEVLISYLFELACGIHSMIFGDDQIASQVRETIQLANEMNASDSVLNTLFRHAITCAKKAKTKVILKSVSPSVATQAVDILKSYSKELKGRRALVIGNGEIGRSVSRALLAAGCEVYMTLRTYKYKQNVVPEGCLVTEYEKRTDLFPKVDILISATKSPHHTVSYEAIADCGKKPEYIMDLALPRDIDPKIGKLSDVIYYDIDSIGKNALQDNAREISMIKEIVSGQKEKYYDWLSYRNIKQMQILEECKQ